MGEIRQQLQGGDDPAQRAGSPSLERAISPENPIYQGALAGTDYTARDVSTRNDSATQPLDTGNIRGICSLDVPGTFEVSGRLARTPVTFVAGAGDTEVDSRLFLALQDASRSALGMPSSVDTIKAMLTRAGLALVLA